MEEAKAFISNIVSKQENCLVLVQKLKEVYGDNRRLKKALQRQLRFFQPILRVPQSPQTWQQTNL